jgi:hypothetical protein
VQKRILHRAVVALLMATLSPLTLIAQATEPDGADEVAAFVIESVEFRITGRTRQWVLEDILDLEPGRTFVDEEDLLGHLARQQQILLNQRSLQEAEVEATFDQPDGTGDATASTDAPAAEGPQPVRIVVTTRDTWNVIVLPYARYDSNTGLLLSLRGRDYNFFGTLQELEVNFDYERTDKKKDLFTISSNFSIPFNMLERRWRLIFEQDLELKADEFDLSLALGLGYDFELLGLGWQAIYKQTFRYISDDKYEDTAFNTSSFSVGTRIGLPVYLPAFGQLSYAPSILTETSYRPGGMSDKRRGVILGFDHALEAGGYDWVGNYRRGESLSVGNENRYNIDKDEWDAAVTARAAVYRALWQPSSEVWPKAGVSAATSAFYLIDGADEVQENAAEDARGILNDTMNGDLGVFLNLDAIVTVWTLRPIFEAQFGVFFDTALVRDLRGDFYGSTAFDAERDLRFGSGIEVIGFPLFARSLYVRGSLGFDLREVAAGTSPLDGDAREIFIGLGHHY